MIGTFHLFSPRIGNVVAERDLEEYQKGRKSNAAAIVLRGLRGEHLLMQRID